MALLQLVSQGQHVAQDHIHGNTPNPFPANLKDFSYRYAIGFNDGLLPPLSLAGLQENIVRIPSYLTPSPYQPTLDKLARRIQAAWRRCVSDPSFAVCRRRLLREFHLDIVPASTYSDGFCNREFDDLRACRQFHSHAFPRTKTSETPLNVWETPLNV